jgi:hypothetical protein
MDKMLQRREQLYQQGFAQVNSRYNWINRETTNPTNTAAKQDFIKRARENLKNLAAMDLSQPQNVDAATNVFEPFVKNTNILGDQAVTEHWMQQENIGESYRLKDGGKEFNEDNVNYVRMQRAAYAQDDPSSWNNYYSNKRYYTPYYDVDKEVNEKMADFKPDSSDITNIKGMYFVREKDASVRPEAVRRYLDAVLSDKAKQQLKISAVARMGADRNVLISNYQTTAGKQIKEIDKEVELVKTRLKIEKDPNIVQQSKDYISYLEDRKETYNRDIDNINKGNTASIFSKIEDIAYDVLYDQKLKKVSNGYARKDYTRDISENGVATMMYSQSAQDARQEDAQRHEKEMKMLELSGGIPGAGGISTTITGEDDASTVKSIADVQSMFNDVATKQKTESANLSKAIINYYRNDGVVSAEDKLTEADLIRDPSLVKNFITKNPQLQVVQEFKAKMNEYEAESKLATSYINSARQKASANLTDQEKKALKDFESKVTPVGTITFREGQKFKNYSPEEIYKGLLDGTVTYKKQGGVGYLNVGSKQYLLGPGTQDPYITRSFNQISKIKDMIDDDKLVSGTIKKFNKEVNNMFSSDPVTSISTAKMIGDDTKYGKALRDRLKGLLPTVTGTIDIQGVQQSFRNNRTYFSVSAGSDKARLAAGTEEAEVSTENVLKILKSKLTGTGAKVGTWSGGVYIEDPNMMATNTSSMYTRTEKLMMDGDKYARDGYVSPYWYPLDKATGKSGSVLPQFRYEKSIDFSGSPKYYLFDGSGGGMLGGKVYSDLHDLFIDAKSYSLDPTALQILKP